MMFVSFKKLIIGQVMGKNFTHAYDFWSNLIKIFHVTSYQQTIIYSLLLLKHEESMACCVFSVSDISPNAPKPIENCSKHHQECSYKFLGIRNHSINVYKMDI